MLRNLRRPETLRRPRIAKSRDFGDRWCRIYLAEMGEARKECGHFPRVKTNAEKYMQGEHQ
jgi:hypothetical protein